MGAGVLHYPGNHGPEVIDLVMFFSLLIISLESLAMGPKIKEENGGLNFGIVLLGNDGLLGSVHAAH